VVTSAKQEPSLISTQRRLFHRAAPPMNYEAFNNDSLTMMYEGIRGALAADDGLCGLGEEPRFRVRVRASAMACSLSSVPRTSVACWWGGSTAGPPH